MLVNKFSRLGIFAVTFRFRAKRTDHLRMAADTTFADVKIAAESFQSAVRFHCRDRRHVALNEIHGNDFYDSADEDSDRSQDREDHRFAFQPAMTPGILRAAEMRLVLYRSRLRFNFRNEFTSPRCLPEVIGHEQCSKDVERTADCAQAIHWEKLNDRFQEIWILHETVCSELLPHQPLSDAAPVHRNDVEHHP